MCAAHVLRLTSLDAETLNELSIGAFIGCGIELIVVLALTIGQAQLGLVVFSSAFSRACIGLAYTMSAVALLRSRCCGIIDEVASGVFSRTLGDAFARLLRWCRPLLLGAQLDRCSSSRQRKAHPS